MLIPKTLIGLAVLSLALSACATSQEPETEPELLKTEAPTETPIPPTPTELPPTPTKPPALPTLVPFEIPQVDYEGTQFTDWLTMFAYDHSQEVQYNDKGETVTDGVTIHDISFPSPVRGVVKAYLVEGLGDDPHPGVLFLHWYEPGAATSNRKEYLDTAVALAQQGVSSILIDEFFPWKREPSGDVSKDREAVIWQTLEAERALDVLLAQPNMDASRIAVVGHDFGAMYASLVAAIDPRVNGLVFVAGTGSFSDWYLKFWSSPSGEEREEYYLTMATVDPINYLPEVHAPVLFQFADSDQYVSEDMANTIFAAANDPKEIALYTAGHEMNEASFNDLAAWLLELFQSAP